MKSWGEELFLKINKFTGENKWLDRFMIFCAHDLIYFLVFIAFMWSVAVLSDLGLRPLKNFIKLLMTAGAFGIILSWMIALLLQKRRPSKKYKDIKQLIHPFSTWKTFPSDHTIFAFIIVIVSALMGAPLWFTSILLLFALLVGVGRVYVGIHYPQDIIGGIVVAIIASLSSPWLLNKITQPIYNLFKQLFL